METIHVCFALHDSKGCYSKYLGIAVMSLFEKTESKICVHILCDDTVSEAHKQKFNVLASQYGQKIIFYEIDTSRFRTFKKRVVFFSIGTLFRLQILETLPVDLERIIYLDDDLLINMDIRELWEADLTDKALAACRNIGIPIKLNPYPCRMGWISQNDYFNAGVMVINLVELRRRENFFDESIRFLVEYPECSFVDQDAYNVFFKGKVHYLPGYCNLFTVYLRQSRDVECHGICHFAGDYIDSECPFWFDKMYFLYWERSPWGGGSEVLPYFLVREKRHGQQILLWQRISEVCIGKKRPYVIWGVSSILRTRFEDVCPSLAIPDWFIDSNSKLQGTMEMGKVIHSPDVLTKYGESQRPFVLVMSMRFYHDISDKLTDYGYREFEDYVNGSLLLLQSQGGEFMGY